MIQRPVQFRLTPRFEGFHSTFQHFHIQRKADFVNLAALIFAQQFTCAADFQIVIGQHETCPQILQRFNRINAFTRISTQRFARRR